MKITTLEEIRKAKAGEIVYYTGTIFTARDAAHIRLEKLYNDAVARGDKNPLDSLPVDFSDSLIYYAGPTPTKPSHAVGSIGPTTSSRMDHFAYLMKNFGVAGTIGKGNRSEECRKIYSDDRILYFIATGGCGALLSKSVKKCEIIAFEDLGTESIKRLEVENFPIMTAFDLFNGNIFNSN